MGCLPPAPMQHNDFGELIDADQLRPMVAEVLSQAGQTYEHKQGRQTPGKIVLQMVDEPSLGQQRRNI